MEVKNSKPVEDKAQKSVEVKNIKPQEVVTIFREIKALGEEKQWITYPELEAFFEKGFYIEDFKQSMIGNDRYMITFSFRKFS